jgi:competence ComEA-like helix-hairpin-helix protein
LSEPFAGGRFHGHHLAGVEIGSINGQDEWALQAVDVAFNPPPAGTWELVLMLREWTANGFVTRDFIPFAVPFVSAPVVEQTPALLVEKRFVPVTEKTIAPVVAKAPAPVTAKAPAQDVTKALARVSPAKAPAAAAPKGVSVNTARAEELAAVKGLNAKLAQAIVKKRPFASLDDLCNVKGLGEKTLAKVRSSLRV